MSITPLERSILDRIGHNIELVLSSHGCVAGDRDPAEIDRIISEIHRINDPLWARIPHLRPTAGGEGAAANKE